MYKIQKVLLISILGAAILCSCSRGSVSSKQNAASKALNSTSSQSIKVSDKKENHSIEKEVISDLVKWNHPMKHALENNKMKLLKVELLKQKTYPVFYVDFPFDMEYSSAYYFKTAVNQFAAANGYWDFELIDTGRSTTIKVLCDKSKGSVKEIIVNGKVDYFNELLKKYEASLSEDDKVMNYLTENVPEINEFGNSLDKYSKDSKVKVTLTVRIDSKPDANSSDEFAKNYYSVYVGENHDTHTSRWNTFLVHKNLDSILAEDVITGKYIPLKEWRKAKDKDLVDIQ